MERFIAELPKAEIHVHLEGTIRPQTLLALARRHGVELPARDETGLAEWFRFRDFPHFVEIYLTCSRCLVDPEDFHLLTLDFLAEQARQRVLWSEAHFSISTHLANGRDGEALRQAIREAAEEGKRRWGVRLGLIPDIVRNAPKERADWTIEWALADPPAGPGATGHVVALGCAGIEVGFPADPFREHFDAAASAGLGCTAHAGEHGGPDSIRIALDVLGAERIDHGVAAVGDPELLARLVAERVPLTVCPSSNVCLGVAPDLAHHPFEALRRAGAAVSINSDDPPLFATTLNDEYLRLAEAHGYGEPKLRQLAAAAFEHSFLPVEEREGLAEIWAGPRERDAPVS